CGEKVYSMPTCLTAYTLFSKPCGKFRQYGAFGRRIGQRDPDAVLQEKPGSSPPCFPQTDYNDMEAV
ncbi:MAG: hypothetical protein OEL68_10095, partial [Desulfobulbaceae bacterium]|nr:hypothetical protein [Desulfobulbaceae bacterium]